MNRKTFVKKYKREIDAFILKGQKSGYFKSCAINNKMRLDIVRILHCITDERHSLFLVAKKENALTR